VRRHEHDAAEFDRTAEPTIERLQITGARTGQSWGCQASRISLRRLRRSRIQSQPGSRPPLPAVPAGHVRRWVPPGLVPRRRLAGLAVRWRQVGPEDRLRRARRRSLWTDGSLRTLCTLRASRTDRPGRASFARRSGRTLRPRCRTAWLHTAQKETEDKLIAPAGGLRHALDVD
jgi:hypothetical protein